MWNRLRECGWICEWDGKSQLGGKLFVNNYKRPRVYFSFFFNQIVTFRNKLTSFYEGGEGTEKEELKINGRVKRCTVGMGQRG